ncbi:MAG: iron-sulfur cluster insertion protein ErpA [Polymorphobacter sp.]
MTSPQLMPAAAARVAAIAARQGKPGLMLRLAVDGGGCAGFQYRFGLETDAAADDLLVETDGVTMLVDAVSLPFLEGAQVDFVETIGAASFQVKNPNAQSGCGCGSSFSV